MKRKSLLLSLVVVLCFSVSAVNAASISLSPTSQDVFVGDPVSFDIFYDFTDIGTLGGGFNISYNEALLSFASVVYDPIFFSDPSDLFDPRLDPTQPDTLTTDLLNGFSFGSLTGYNDSAFLGTLMFNTLATGTVNLTLADNVSPYGPFLDGSGGTIDVTYEGATVNINAVPIPGALLLLGSGLVGLVGLRRKLS